MFARLLSSCSAARSRLFARTLFVVGTLATALPAHAELYTFKFKADDAKSVFLAGEMTQWDTGKKPMYRDKHGTWSLTLDLEPGLWVYKFVVDGQWIADPRNPLSDADGLGGRHSVLALGKGDWQPAHPGHRGDLISLNYPSQVLGQSTKVNIYLPKAYSKKKTLPLTFLLHGRGLDADQWVKTGRIHHYLDNLIARGVIPPQIVVMPSSGIVPYIDASEKFITEELLGWLKTRYGIEGTRQSTAIAGMSMGGFGAFNLALRHPQLFGVSVPVSGVYFPEYVASLPDALPSGFRLHLMCGTSDAFIGMNRDLATALTARGLNFTYQEAEGGHDWHYWGKHTPAMLKAVGDYFAGRS